MLKKNIRYATQLDHAPNYLDDNDGQHPLINQLSNDVGSDPLQQLIYLEESETDPYQEKIIKLGFSKLAGFMLLLRDLAMTRHQSVKSLLMSTSWLYICILRAQECDEGQNLLFNDMPLMSADQLHTWRPFKIKRTKITPTISKTRHQLSLSL